MKKKAIAVLIAEEFQPLEAWYPYLRFKEAGYETWYVGLERKEYIGKYNYAATAEKRIDEVKADDLAGLIIPGGWAPEKLRQSPEVIALVQEMHAHGKLVAAVCHAGWVLASADIVQGRHVTSYRGIRDDMVHAGGIWEDQEVVVDGNLVTSRVPADLPAFCRECLGFLRTREEKAVSHQT